MSNKQKLKATGPFSPLKEQDFRRIWTTSVLGNLGQLMLGVGAAWQMTQISSSPTMVALVQTAMMLPLMLASIPAGAFADMFDQRKVAMTGLLVSIVSAIALAIFSSAGLATPLVLLSFCFLIGVGVAIYTPAWQASINEQVTPENLPAAVALGTISYNVARSFGPALGGFIVLALGAQAVFALNAVFYLPLLLAFFLWTRDISLPRLPPERVVRAIVSGSRYVFHSPMLNRILIRIFLFGLTGATATALAPLIAKDLLGGDAGMFGIILGAGGAGAVLGALFVSYFRARFGTEWATRALLMISSLALIGAGLSEHLLLTCVAMFIVGASNILIIALYNVAVQLSAPRWVLARTLALFGSALTGGIALGAWAWGEVATISSVGTAVTASGLMMMILPLVSIFLPLRENTLGDNKTIALNLEPKIGLPITLGSGPIIVEIDYRVAAEHAREFFIHMTKLRSLRLRNGGYTWSISCDIADPTLWTERYECPTWADYLRVRDRQTESDHNAYQKISTFLVDGENITVRRRLGKSIRAMRWPSEMSEANMHDGIFIAP